MKLEARARVDIDQLLTQANWHVCGVAVAKKQGSALSGIEPHFTSRLDSAQRARGVFVFLRAYLLAQWLELIVQPALTAEARIVDEAERYLYIFREVEAEVDTNFKRSQALRQAALAKSFS